MSIKSVNTCLADDNNGSLAGFLLPPYVVVHIIHMDFDSFPKIRVDIFFFSFSGRCGILLYILERSGNALLSEKREIGKWQKLLYTMNNQRQPHMCQIYLLTII